MKLNEVNIILVAATNFTAYLKNINEATSYDEVKEELWQYRWHKKMPNSSLIEGPSLHDDDNITPNQAFLQWVSVIKLAIANSSAPVVLICHSYGVCAALTAISDLIPNSLKQIKAALFVAPAFFTMDEAITLAQLSKLSFPSFLISSTNDGLLTQVEAKKMAANLGSLFLDAGENGHINTQSGHGPWPEGLLLVSRLLGQI